MKFQNDVWIFEHVPCKDSHDMSIGVHFAALPQSFNARKRCRRSRFASDTIAANDGFGRQDFFVANIECETVGKS